MSPRKKVITPKKRDSNDPWGLKSKSPISKPIAKQTLSPVKGRQLFNILEQNKNKSWLEMMEESDDSNDMKPTTAVEQYEKIDPNGDLLMINEDNKEDIKQEVNTQTNARKTRKAAVPQKKTDSQPKFQKSLNKLTGMLLNRRSERIRAKHGMRDISIETEIENLRNEAAQEGVRLPEIDYRATYKIDQVVVKQELVEVTDCIVRKRRLSVSSTTTDTTSPGRRKAPRMYTPNREISSRCSVPRSRTSSRADSTRSTPMRNRISIDTPIESPNPRDGWETPKQGWCYDEATLARRTKEIEMAKEKEVYITYINEVKKHERKRGIHPRTPNKFINYSRRSWDAQLRAWKRSLYEWAGMSPSSSVFNSINGSVADSSDLDERNNLENESPSNILTKAVEKIGEQPIYNPDQMASLMGHFDLHTREGESTLKAPNNESVKGPVDFSQINV